MEVTAIMYICQIFDQCSLQCVVNAEDSLPFPAFLLVSSVDNLSKQFGPRSGPTKRRAWSVVIYLTIYIVILCSALFL